MIPRAKHELSDNETLQRTYALTLDKTPAIKGNRALTEQEYQNMLKLSKTLAEKGSVTAKNIPDLLKICKTMGLRITEAVAITRSQAEQALRTGIYQVKGEAKNGKWREVPLSKDVKTIFEKRLTEVSRGNRLFVNEGEKVHLAVNRYEQFLKRHREKIETPEGRKLRTWEKYEKTHTNELTFHGLRYNYIQFRMQQEMEKGYSLEQAAARITQEVGHERTDVIKIYLGGKFNN